MKRVVWILLVLVLIVGGCAKANDPMVKTHKMQEVLRIGTTGEPYSVQVDGNLLFSAENYGGFWIYDKNSGAALDTLIVYNGATVVLAKNIKIHPESKLALLHNLNVNGKLHTIDYSDPSSLINIIATDQGNTNKINDICLVDEPASSDKQFTLWRALPYTAEGDFSRIIYAYVKNNNLVFDESKNLDINFVPYRLCVDGNYMFVAAGFLGVRVFDLNNVTSGSYNDPYDQQINTPGEVSDIQAKGNYLYIADEQGGFHIAKLNANKSGSIIKTFKTSGNASRIAINDSYAAVACGSGGVNLYRISNPEKVELIDTMLYSEIGYVNNVYFDADGFLYVLSRDQGIIKYRVN